MPDNGVYYQAAYAAAAVIFAVYTLSLYLRRKRLRDETSRHLR